VSFNTVTGYYPQFRILDSDAAVVRELAAAPHGKTGRQENIFAKEKCWRWKMEATRSHHEVWLFYLPCKAHSNALSAAQAGQVN